MGGGAFGCRQDPGVVAGEVLLAGSLYSRPRMVSRLRSLCIAQVTNSKLTRTVTTHYHRLPSSVGGN